VDRRSVDWTGFIAFGGPETIGPMPASIPPSDPADSQTTNNVLADELAVARQHGLKNPDHPLPHLLTVARLVSSKPTDAEKLEDALTKAIARLGGTDTEAIMALLGFTDDTRGLPVEHRRKKAAALAGQISPESFRRGKETALLQSAATHLSILAERQPDQDTAPANASGSPEAASVSPATSDGGATRAPSTPDANIGAEADAAWPAPAPQSAERRGSKRSLPAVLVVCLIAGTAILIAALASGNTASRHCGPIPLEHIKSAGPGALFNGRTLAFIYAPHESAAEHGWPPYISTTAARERFHFGESRIMALAAANASNTAETGTIARLGLPPRARLQSDSTCIYRSPTRLGVASAGTALVESSGLKLRSIAAHTAVYLTFIVELPPPSTEHQITTYGVIGPASEYPEPNWYSSIAVGSLTLPLAK
jgi:hypothetical protein